MKDTKAFYAARAAELGFLTTAHVKDGQESVTKMTPSYQAAVFDLVFDMLAGASSILDVGCGTGDLLPYLRSRGWVGRYVGVDIVPGFIEGCQTHYDDPDAFFVCGDFTDRKFRKSLGKFDTVTSLSVFGLVDRPSFIREMVESCFDSAEKQYVFTCNSTEGYDVVRNKDAMIYSPLETLTMVLGFTHRLELRHMARGEGKSAIMGWRMLK